MLYGLVTYRKNNTGLSAVPSTGSYAIRAIWDNMPHKRVWHIARSCHHGVIALAEAQGGHIAYWNLTL